MEHPCGIEPWGNYYMRGGGPNIRDAGLGALSVLSDALLLELLGSGALRAADLARLALASKALYCFANLEEVWKGLVIEEHGGRFTWCGTWQRTYLVSTGLLPPEPAPGADPDSEEEEEAEEEEANGEANGEAEEEQVEERKMEQEAAAVAAAGGEGGRRAKRRKTGDARGAVASPAAAAAPGAAASNGQPAKQPAGTVAGAEGRKGNKKLRGKGKAGSADCEEPVAAAAAAAPATAPDGNAAGPGPSSAAAAGANGNGHQQRRRGRGCALMRLVPGCGRQRYLRVHGFYSDLLYQPWFCATLEPMAEWLEIDNIDRRSGLTPEQFRTEYEIPNRPVILTDVMAGWPAMRKWSSKHLAEVFGDRDVIVGNMPMPFSTYLCYCSANRDEQPFYLFDKRFAEAGPGLADDYAAPAQFGEDLFALLGPGRPDYRWLILGPARSGSNFHVDPNATSAWNALVWGAKKWVLYPPGVPPPGVHPSPDGADVAQPFSLTEWFVNFYAATREGKVRPVEFVARPGELLFVPRGWWHCALNLEESCALTQNFVSEVGLPATLSFLQSRRPELVSGCAVENRCNLYDRFVSVLREQRPQLLAAVEARREEARAKAREANRLAALFKPPAAQHADGASDSQGGQDKAAEGGAGTCAGASRDVGNGSYGAAAAAGGGGGFSFGFSFGASSGAAEGGSGADAGTANGSGGGFKFGFGL